jgi:hypothetical protein
MAPKSFYSFYGSSNIRSNNKITLRSVKKPCKKEEIIFFYSFMLVFELCCYSCAYANKSVLYEKKHGTNKFNKDLLGKLIPAQKFILFRFMKL